MAQLSGRAGTDLTGRRVLVVEDDYYLAHDTQLMLEDAGAIVLGPCAGAEEGVRLLENEAVKPDCAVVDLNLGHGVSFEVPSWLSDHGVPFVFVTGYDAGMLPERFRGAPRFEKPVSMGGLLRSVAQLVEGSHG